MNLKKQIDFIDKNKKKKKKNLGIYFKYMLINNKKLSPTEAKIIFKEKFKNINLDTKEIITYIDTKYRESYNINKEKFLFFIIKQNY